MSDLGLIKPESLDYLAETYAEVPLGGGVARIKTRDKAILDEYAAVIGMRNAAKGGINLLESDWVATANALYYITPRARHLDRYQWSEIEEVSIVRQRLAKALVSVRLIGGLDRFEIETSRSSSDKLVRLWAEHRQA